MLLVRGKTARRTSDKDRYIYLFSMRNWCAYPTVGQDLGFRTQFRSIRRIMKQFADVFHDMTATVHTTAWVHQELQDLAIDERKVAQPELRRHET